MNDFRQFVIEREVGGRTSGRTDGRMDGWTDGRTDGRGRGMDGRANGRPDGRHRFTRDCYDPPFQTLLMLQSSVSTNAASLILAALWHTAMLKLPLP